MQMAGYRCAICGKKIYRKAQLHHVLPYTFFPEYETDIRNIMLLCVKCHNEVHRNPYINIRLMEQKSKELGCERKLLGIKQIVRI
jgi:5-methylcytosine-specific restriction endonuclease McrA